MKKSNWLNLISCQPILIELGKELGVKDDLLVPPRNSIELNHEVEKQLEQYEVFRQWSTHQLSYFLWNLFAERDEKIADSVSYYLVEDSYEGEYSIRDYFLDNDCAVRRKKCNSLQPACRKSIF